MRIWHKLYCYREMDPMRQFVFLFTPMLLGIN